MALLNYAARPQPGETMLIQSAAGGVGSLLVQLARRMGVKVVALVSSREKIEFVKNLGADAAIDYSWPGWMDKARAALGGEGADIVLEAASGEVGEQSFRLLAPFGRMVVYGARNIHDTFGPEQMTQLIRGNRTITGFNFPSLRPEQIAACVPELLQLISAGELRIFADNRFALDDVVNAFVALASRSTIGRVVLVPEAKSGTAPEQECRQECTVR